MDGNPFVSYLLQKVVLQSVLVIGIVVAGFYLVEDHVKRWDLTEDSRYSISEYSHELAGSLKNPLTIRAYFSENLPPSDMPYQQQVFDVLSEYVAHGKGKIKIERRDPTASTEIDSEAKNFGVQPVVRTIWGATQRASVLVYGGIVLLYGDKESEVINIAQRYGQGYEGLSALEYEISSGIWQLTHDKPRIGLTGYMEKQPEGNPFGGGGGPPQPEFTALRRFLGEDFEVESVDLKQTEPDPEKMPLLVVVRPKEFGEVEVYRLDQYLVKGGRVLMFITEGTVGQGSPFGPPGWQFQPFKTGLDEWLEHNGLRVPNEIVCHAVSAPETMVEGIVELDGRRFRAPMQAYNWFWPKISASVDGSFSQDNPAIRSLPGIVLLWPHPVDVLNDRLDGKVADVLVRSHGTESWRWKDLGKIDMRQVNFERDAPSAGAFRSSPLAVDVAGRFTSYFGDEHPVPPSVAGSKEEEKNPDGCGDGEGCGEGCGDGCGDGSGDGSEADGEKKEPAPAFVKQGTKPTHLVVIGNAVFISDPALKRQSDDEARQIGLLAFNLADWLARSPELIALRAKRYSNRELVDEEYQAYAKRQDQLLKDGDIDEATRDDRLARAKEDQQSRWKATRWLNIAIPCALVLVAGLVVWILRKGLRGAGSVPAPDVVRPESGEHEDGAPDRTGAPAREE